MMKEIIISEIERMWGRRKTKIGILLFFVYLALMCLWLKGFGQSFYDPAHAVRLNSLNFAPFLLKEVSFFLSLVFLPMFLVDSFNGEYTSGAYRLVLLRPRSRGQLLLAKWLSQSLVLFLFLAVTLVAGLLCGRMFLPSADTVHFLNESQPLDAVDALVYTLQFYGLTFLVLFSILFFLASSETVFRVLASEGAAAFYPVLFASIVLGYGISFYVWARKDMIA
jgi:ABC-2 type transport system permease protein